VLVEAPDGSAGIACRHGSRRGRGLPVVAAAAEPVDRGIDVVADRVRRAVGDGHHEAAVWIARSAPAQAAGWEKALLVEALKAAETSCRTLLPQATHRADPRADCTNGRSTGDEHADDRDDRQEFNEGKGRAAKPQRKKHGGGVLWWAPDA